jgi:uronate dehydrogenase
MSMVLVTGATGEVARGVLPFLQSAFSLRLLAPDVAEDDPYAIRADVLDWTALSRGMNGVDAVLHLAVASGHSGTYEDDLFNDQRFDVNVKGTFHVFETARRAGVLRVVHVSSVMAVWGHGLALVQRGAGGLISGNAPAWPVGTYALTKTLSEEIAHHYARSCGMEVITLRIAAPFDVNDPRLHERAIRPQQIPFPDLAQAFLKALTVPLARYELVTIVGHSSKCCWDLEAARRVLGYCPQYRLDDLGVTFAEPFAVESR